MVDDCRYSHTGTPAICEGKNGKGEKGKGKHAPRACRFFAKGECGLGEECPYVQELQKTDDKMKGTAKGEQSQGKGKGQANDAAPAWAMGGNAACAVDTPAVCAVVSDRPVP